MPNGTWPARGKLPVSRENYMRHGCHFARVGPERSGRVLDGKQYPPAGVECVEE